MSKPTAAKKISAADRRRALALRHEASVQDLLALGAKDADAKAKHKAASVRLYTEADAIMPRIAYGVAS